MNQKLIKQLQEGTIAVHNDGTVEELRLVLNEAFPKDNANAVGVHSYYQKEGDNMWDSDNQTNLPSYSVKEFLKEEFVLPEKWHIIPNNPSELKIIGKWFDESEFAHPDDKTFYQNLSENLVGMVFGGKSSGNVINNLVGEEITFEEFKKYVLKEETMEKKIIGYKLIKPEYKEAVYKITKLTNFSVLEKYLLPEYKTNLESYSKCVDDIKDAGVLDLWFEPVYEQEFKVGDYVTVIKAVGGFNGEEGKTYKIFGWQENYENKFYYTEDCQPTINTNEVKVRLATAEEIKAAETIKIGEYEVKFTPNGVVIENVKYTSVEIATLADLIKRGQIKTLRVGCMGQYTVDLEVLEKILKRFK